ncbi:TolB family protein [Heliophilum fasciatum]|uniref:WD40 repeat protein n=1 Tax=Heliophilum fasciatum TaxID=35700 RepID=A0A4R2RXJ6_9FIRM|nr:PD40 domain-containing protein [Heliophilum fasciatum]MCW2277156.1 hypothetical protein [Heliophilum fasciatum]TCP68208.1 WD40 repeat protein [Heliophilum fasciatum]
MKRLMSGIPFIAALLMVLLAAYTLVTSKQTPLFPTNGEDVQGDRTQILEPKILPPPSNMLAFYPYTPQFIDLGPICEQAVLQGNQPLPVPTPSVRMEKKPTDVGIAWSSLTLNHQRDRIAFQTKSGLYVVNLRTKQSARVFSLPDDGNSRFGTGITWNPEDTHLTFTEIRGGTSEGADATLLYRIHLLQLDDLTDKIIHETFSQPDLPLWSPDGRYVALDNPLVLMERKTGKTTPVGTGKDARHPRWSPDSNYLVFMQYSAPDRAEIYRYTMETKEMLPLTSMGKAARAVEWLKSPSTILMETENYASGVDTGRHHVGEVRPHSESSIRWLSPFDRQESNRYYAISPNERYVILRKTEPYTTNGSEENAFSLIGVNRELNFFSWHFVRLHSFAANAPLSFAWGKDGKLLYLTEAKATVTPPATVGAQGTVAAPAGTAWEMYSFDFEQQAVQKVWETPTPTRLIGVDGSIIYHSPY